MQESIQCTESQVQDVLYLRQLFYHKLGQLARERQSLLRNMMRHKMEMSHVSDKLSETTRWSDELRENGAEEYRAYLQFTSVYLRGVCLHYVHCSGYVLSTCMLMSHGSCTPSLSIDVFF